MHNVTDVIPWDDTLFIDCETRSPEGLDRSIWGNVTQTSVMRYAETAYPILITWAEGLEGPVHRWETRDITRPPTLDELPPEIRRWDGYFAAWNSGFDRHILDRFLEQGGIEAWIDMMAHAAYNNLPLGLDRAAKACGSEGKIDEGKKLIKVFCAAGGATPESEPEKWHRFCDYADVDVSEMQTVAASSVQVPLSIWREFWVSERINDRGLPYDPAMAEGGAAIAEKLNEGTVDRTLALTGGDLKGVKQYAKQQLWIADKLRYLPQVLELMIVAERDNPTTKEREYKYKMDRPVITSMIALLEGINEDQGLTDDEWVAMQFLREREFGASAAPAKFQKMLDMEDSRGRLPGQYTFSGATQTGRFSSRGIQVHNMTRSTIGDIDTEDKACNMLADGVAYDAFEAEFGNVGAALSKLIRPTICADEGKLLTWGDWSNIEARGLPWLARAEHRLDVFRAIDADPDNTPDVYLQAAAGMYGHDPYKLLEGHLAKDTEAKGLRQKGKIAELALGFNGGPGALQSMAANYGMSFEGDEAKDIVDRWRKANDWAVEFWKDVWQAFLAAYNRPDGTQHVAGRVSYQGVRMGPRVWVICYLPDGRPLFYRNVRDREVKTYDPFDPKVVIKREQKLSFEGESGIKYLWAGLLVENITQAACASVLRGTLVWLDHQSTVCPVVGHTHDEIVTEHEEHYTEATQGRLERAMLRDHGGWYDGLPLGVDISTHKWYSKAVE